jgi:hypothetical protein
MRYNEVYEERRKKVDACIRLENEHVVSTFMGQAVAPTYTDGINLAEYMTDHTKGLECYINFLHRMNRDAPIDCFNFGYPGGHQGGLSITWWSKLLMPGKELPVNAIWQVEERKNLEDSDYDQILKEGSAESVQNRILSKVATPDVMEAFVSFNIKNFDKVMLRYCEAGFPALNSGLVVPPFETLCGGRSMATFFRDCYKQIDKVKAVQDVMMKALREQIRSLPKADYMIGRWVGGWRGASNLVNQKIWDALVWPYMKELALLLLDQGITPIMHLDACWDRDLERFLELPAKKIILNPDGMTDLRKARKILGNHASFLGDVPSQMLVVSSKEEIKDYVRRLLDDIGTQGVFIAPGCDAPHISKYENLVAIYEAAQEY